MILKTPTRETKPLNRLKINTLIEGFNYKNKNGEKVTPKKIVRL